MPAVCGAPYRSAKGVLFTANQGDW